MKSAVSMLLLSCLTSFASADPNIHDVLAKWRSAVHATNAQTVQIESTSNEDGVPGNITEEINTHGEYRRTVKRQFDQAELVLTDQFAERLDWNGFLRKLEGRELSRWRTAALESQWLAIGPPKNVANAKIGKTLDGKLLSLTITSSTAEAITWLIDPTTGLPIQSERPGNDTEIVHTYADWQTIGTILAPGIIHVSETDKPAYDVRWITIENEKTSAKRFNHLNPGSSDVQISNPIPPIPFTFESAHIVFKMQLNGHNTMDFLLDTGADQEVINETRMNEFGLKTYAKSTTTGGGNSAPYGYAESATFKLPGVELKNQHVAVLDLSGLEAALGIQLGGILGYDFISRFVIGIDYDNKLIQLYDPNSWSYSGKGFIVPIVFDEGIPFSNGSISVSQKEIPAFFVMDFGAAETATLTSPFVKGNDLLTLAQTNATVNRPAGMEKQFFAQSNVRGHIDRLTIGNLTAESIPINLSMNTSGAYASTNFSGTVGEGIYQRYHVFLDYARNRAIFEPTEATKTPFPNRQTYGVNLLASGDDLHIFTVVAVRPESPAEKDGLQKADVIAGLDGKAASQFTLSELRDALSHESEKHELKIVRGEQKLTIPITVHVISLDK